jgi:hypothetical protein
MRSEGGKPRSRTATEIHHTTCGDNILNKWDNGCGAPDGPGMQRIVVVGVIRRGSIILAEMLDREVNLALCCAILG